MEHLRGETCCFTGHRPDKLPWGENEQDPGCLDLKASLGRELSLLYRRGYRRFLCGMARGADLYFGEAVLALAQIHPDVCLEAAIPCRDQADRWSEADKARRQAILDGCQVRTLVQEHYDKWCMLRRDRYMVDCSSAIVAVFNGTRGGTMYTLNYAMEHKLDIVLMDLNHPWQEATRLTLG